MLWSAILSHYQKNRFEFPLFNRTGGKIPLLAEGVATEGRRGSVGSRSRSEFPFLQKGWRPKVDGVVSGDDRR